MRLALAVVLFTLLAAIGESCLPSVNFDVTKKLKSGKALIRIRNNNIVLSVQKNDGTAMENVLSTSFSKGSATRALSIVEECEKYTTCVKAGDETIMKILADPKGEIIKVTRSVEDPQGQIRDCFQLTENTEWYGGPQLRHQHWPIQHMYYEEEPYVPTHPQNMALAERYWLSSKGIFIIADERDPLFLDQNNHLDKHLCLISQNKSPYHERNTITLNYEIGVFANPRLAHEYVIENHFGKPTGHPNERMVTHPIWSTWARYKAAINESVVREFAADILKNGFKNSQLEIDDNWETCYGSAMFDPVKFPNIKQLLADLKELGFRVTLWIHPFINEGCNDGVQPAYSYALESGYFVENTEGEVHTTWWQGEKGAAAIDFTNSDAVDWWVGRLKLLEELGIDSFKFDAGETSWLPQTPDLLNVEDIQPGIYTKKYVEALAANFDDNIEARVGWRTQQLPIFVRMIDKDTRWTWNNGIPTLITTLIQMNMNGYVFVLPDMIGGNGYVNNSLVGTELPPKDMFLRWLQANVFMPSLQYSFVPWDFDAETIQLSKAFTDMHAEYSPKIMELMKKAVETGAPINPPIWWVDPTNLHAHRINDEYLLGEEILVAPVIEENANKRDVYLPTGRWKDGTTKVIYDGPRWLRDYDAPLNVLPHFFKA